MKQLLLTLFALTLSFGFQGCSQGEQSPTPELLSEKFKIPGTLYGASIGDLRLPDGTKTFIENDGATVSFQYPDGIKFLKSKDYSIAANSVMIDPGTGSYTCSGNCTSGCDVFYVQGSFACSQCSNSSPCTGKASRSSSDGGFIDIAAGITFLSTKQQVAELEKKGIQAPNDLFKYEFVRRAMQELNLQVHGVIDPTALIAQNPKLYRRVAVNMYGSLVEYTVPVAYIKKAAANNATGARGESLIMAPNDEAGFSCNCSSGTGGCTSESGIGYKKCNSGACTSCTMTVS